MLKGGFCARLFFCLFNLLSLIPINLMMKGNLEKSSLWHLAIGTVPLLVWLTFYHAILGPTKFDEVKWKEQNEAMEENFPRLRMADYLLQSKMLNGKTITEVIDLLGPTENHSYFPEYDLVYYLGPERHRIFAIDSEWLCIEFDEDGSLKIAEILHD